MYGAYPGQYGNQGGYDQSGYGMGGMGGDKQVFGLPMPAAVYKPASNWMNVQSGIVSCCMCFVCLSCCTSLAIYFTVKDVAWSSIKYGASTPPPLATSLKASAASLGTYTLVGAACHCCIVCICGGAFVALSRYILQTRNKDGLKICCIGEGVFSACGFCEGCCACIQFIFIVSAVASMSDTKSYCKGVTPAATLASCEQATSALQTVLWIVCVWSGLTVCIQCGYAALCGVAAKYADDTGKALEGGFGADQWGGYQAE